MRYIVVYIRHASRCISPMWYATRDDARDAAMQVRSVGMRAWVEPYAVGDRYAH